MGFFRRNRRPRRYLAEIVTADDRLIRRERFTTETVEEAIAIYKRIIYPYMATPGAARVDFYATADEPNAAPVASLKIEVDRPPYLIYNKNNAAGR